MIPGDIGTELAIVLRAAVAAGELPPAAAVTSAAGTWRPAPLSAGGTPGTYATSLAFALAPRTGRSAAELAGMLAPRLAGAAGIGAVSVTGGGYLTVTVTDAALTGLAARVALAGPACAASNALRGTRQPAALPRELAAAASWPQAWRWAADEIIARLAERAGAQITVKIHSKREHPPAPAASPDHSSVPAAIAFAGADAVRYALARAAPGQAGETGWRIPVSNVLANPGYAVCYAHADVASALRWAADLGLPRGQPTEIAAAQLAHPRERELLAAISWLPERVAAAARRRRPDELTGYLEHLAGAWLDCRESCPALPFGGQSAPRAQSGAAARLWLADAARTALAAGLDLLGVAAPPRL